MPLGAELRDARERAGLSAEAIAERTKIQPPKIEALENGNYALLPQGIYLDGIVRAYAREVALNPDLLIERVRSERATLVREGKLPQAELNAFLREEVLESNVAGRRPLLDRSQVAVPPDWGLGETARADVDIVDRSHAHGRPNTLLADGDASKEPPRDGMVSRGLGRFALPLVSLLAVVGWGLYLYEANRPSDRDTMADITASGPRAATPDDRTTQHASATSGKGPESLDRRTPLDANADSARQETTAVVEPPATRAAPAAKAGDAPAPQTPPPSQNKGTPSIFRDVSGSWTLATKVERSDDANVERSQLGFELQLQQAGNRVTGAGRKVTENGGAIGEQGQTPISVEGTIDGDRLTLTFTERGAERVTQGRFVLIVDEGGTMRGRFSSGAAQATGTVEAHRLQ